MNILDFVYLWLISNSAVPVISGVLLGIAIHFILKYKRKYNDEKEKHNAQKQRNVLDDLEIATTEQLMKELRNRNGCPYIMLKPIDDEDKKGIVIESHNMAPETAVSMLNCATMMVFEEFKRRGIDLPERNED